MPRVIAILSVCAILTACASQPAGQQAEPDVQQASAPARELEQAVVADRPLQQAAAAERNIQQASDHFFTTRQHGDASSFAALFADNGAFMVPGLADATGRDAIRELAQVRFASGRSEDFKIERREIEVVGDSAYELAWFSETDRRPGQSFRMQGRHFILWKRGSDEAWRVQRYLYNYSGAEPLP
jgi:uncharacterized protein (TIGR02246 family)